MAQMCRWKIPTMAAARCVSTAGLQEFKIFYTVHNGKENKNFPGYTPTPKEEDKDGGI